MPKRTQVYDYHKQHGHLVDYAGFELPVWFEGIIPECRNVRANAGLFDVSHMGRVAVEGKNAEKFLNHVLTNDVSTLSPGQGHYSLLCNPAGGIVDDLTVFHTARTKYLVVYNAANREKNWKWLHENSQGDVVLTDLSDRSAMFAVQGPKSEELLRAISRVRLDEIDKYSSLEVKVGSLTCFVSRSGYTGEDGFEIYVWETSVDHPENAVMVWEKLLSTGRNYGLKPTGLGARDVLRLEAGMCLYGNDIDEKTTPVEARLNFAVRLDKSSDFIGRAAIQRQKEEGPSRVRIGFRMTDKGIPRQGQEFISDNVEVGKVSSGTLSPTLGFGLGMGYVMPSVSKQGRSFDVKIRGREAAASIVKLPFYQRRSIDKVVVMGEEMGLKEFRTHFGHTETTPALT
jgi:aminomethyltransferase